MHFNSSEERLRYLKGKFEEIVPKEVEPKKAKKKGKKDEVQSK